MKSIDFLPRIIKIINMIKKLAIILSIILLGTAIQAEPTDYEQIYRDLPVPDFSYVHEVDPGEYYDTERSTWSPYPLLRLTAPLYFKTVSINPGYYLLTPRQHEGSWYILFKEAGKVKYIVPAYDRQLTPEGFYDENIPKPKLTFTQKFHIKTLDFVGKVFPTSKREPAPQTYLEMTDLENNFVSMVIYWGNYKYYLILRTIKL